MAGGNAGATVSFTTGAAGTVTAEVGSVTAAVGGKGCVTLFVCCGGGATCAVVSCGYTGDNVTLDMTGENKRETMNLAKIVFSVIRRS